LKGSDIKEYLIENGIKQSYVSEKTGIPAPILNMMLNNNRKIEANEYMRICDAIGVPLEQFKPRIPEKTKEVPDALLSDT
jgi:transcriptional regulator with XRE-family HTH domain